MASPPLGGLSLDDLKRQNYRRREPAVYRLLRHITVRLTWLCLPTSITPNGLTVVGLVISIAAALALATGERVWSASAGALMIAAYALDCMDGELARARGQSSRLGIHLEHLGNWLVVGALQMAIAVGAYRETGDALYLICGMASLIGWYGFYFFFLNAQSWIAGDENFGPLRRFSALLVHVMPLDENLFILGALIGDLSSLAIVSAVSGVGLAIVSLTLFLIPVFRLHKSGGW